MNNPANTYAVPSVSITTVRTCASSKANELGMRAMQARAYDKRGEQYLLFKSPPASGKSRALMFDEVLERTYISRRLKNDTERLE